MGDSMKRVHALSSLPSSSPAMAPEVDEAYPHLVGDKRYALHGEILMLVLVLGFSLILVLVVAVPFVRRSRRGSNESQRRSYFIRNTNPRRVDEDDGAEEEVGNVERNIDNEISRKFPF